MSRLLFIGLRWVGVLSALMLIALFIVMGVGGLRRPPLITYGEFGISSSPSLMMYDVESGQSAALLTRLDSLPVAWSWSPDGQTLAYVMFLNDNNTYSVTLFRPADRQSYLLVSGLPFGAPPEWSPDGAHIALVSPTQDVCLYPVANPQPPQCLNIMPASQPVWSPDGDSIAYISRLPDGGLYRVDIASGTVYELLPSVPYLSGVRWSPDGEQLVFSRQESPGTPRHLMLIDKDGANLTALTAGFGSYNQALWSPNGTHIVFSYFPTAFRYPDIHIVEVSTGRQQSIATHRLIDAEPQWSPDGQLIAFVTDRYDGLPRLQIVRVPAPTDPEPLPSFGVAMQQYSYDWRP